MSEIQIRLSHDSLLWPARDSDDEIKSYSHTMEDGTSVRFGDGGISISCRVEISEEEQDALIKCLTKDNQPFVPHWQTLTPDIERTVLRIEKQIWGTASFVDYCFRRSPKGIRLAPIQLPTVKLNPAQEFPVMHWRLSEEEKIRLEPQMGHLSAESRKRYMNNGIMIPFSLAFDQKQIHLRKDEVDAIFQNIENESEIPPFWGLYGIAWENFAKNKSPDSAILILATAIETAFKWCLREHGDEIAKYFIENMQSPSLDKLYVCTRDHTPYSFPEHFRPWLRQLASTRNFVAHKPRGFEVDTLLVARWFAIGEAILRAVTGEESDPLVGYLVQPLGENADKQLPPDSHGVVLRREVRHVTGEEKLHVLVESGESWYFGEDQVKKLPAAQQKFPDVE